MGQNVSQVNVRQANEIGRVHASKPQMKETYCGRPMNEEEWLITSKEVNCTGWARAGGTYQAGGSRARFLASLGASSPSIHRAAES